MSRILNSQYLGIPGVAFGLSGQRVLYIALPPSSSCLPSLGPPGISSATYGEPWLLAALSTYLAAGVHLCWIIPHCNGPASGSYQQTSILTKSQGGVGSGADTGKLETFSKMPLCGGTVGTGGKAGTGKDQQASCPYSHDSPSG